jgi:hypothetical protein
MPCRPGFRPLRGGGTFIGHPSNSKEDAVASTNPLTTSWGFSPGNRAESNPFGVEPPERWRCRLKNVLPVSWALSCPPRRREAAQARPTRSARPTPKSLSGARSLGRVVVRFVDGKLLVKSQVLDGELAAEEGEEPNQVEQESDHRAEMVDESRQRSTTWPRLGLGGRGFRLASVVHETWAPTPSTSSLDCFARRCCAEWCSRRSPRSRCQQTVEAHDARRGSAQPDAAVAVVLYGVLRPSRTPRSLHCEC